MDLPKSLFCLTVEHNLDDPDTMEQLLAADPRTEECMPVALRNVMNEYAIPAGMPSMPIPNAKTLLDYLTIIWLREHPNTELEHAVERNAIYLLPYLITKFRQLPGIPSGEQAFKSFITQLAGYAIMADHPAIAQLLVFPPITGNGEPAWPAANVNELEPIRPIANIAAGEDTAMMNMLIKAGLTANKIMPVIQFYQYDFFAVPRSIQVNFLKQFLDKSAPSGLKVIQ